MFCSWRKHTRQEQLYVAILIPWYFSLKSKSNQEFELNMYTPQNAKNTFSLNPTLDYNGIEYTTIRKETDDTTLD